MKTDRKALEKEIFDKMTLIYCKDHHCSSICTRCNEIILYAHRRIDLCKFGKNKSFCSKCLIHCFKTDIREDVKKIMRYSGPRIIFHHPLMAFKHMFSVL